jgi:ubiquinone/menaquinone biosynthesis C-methylase UbiE
MSTLPDYRLVSPPLWNQPGWPLSELLPSPRELFAALPADRLPHLRQEITSLPPTAQRELLSSLDLEEILKAIEKDTAALPAERDRENYFAGRTWAYWLSGLGDARFISQRAARRGSPLAAGQTLLDLGCASGRLLRHFTCGTSEIKLLGCDLNRNNIAWMRQHLRHPSLTFFQNTALPHLPLPDQSVDAVTALSVFTHIADFEEAWLLELQRVLKPGGWAFVTVHTDRFWPEIPNHFSFEYLTKQPHAAPDLGIDRVTEEFFTPQMPAPRVVLLRTNYPVNNANVYHHREYLRSIWGQIFDIEEIIPAAHGIHQDALFLRAPG